MHGDRVVARVERETAKGLEGRIVRILERSQQTVVGRYEIDESGLGYVVPFDRRVLTDVQVPTGQSSSAEPGEMVLVEITRWPTRRAARSGASPRCSGTSTSPVSTPRSSSASSTSPTSIRRRRSRRRRRIGGVREGARHPRRTDFRTVTTVTIDGEHARDFDDAITIERLPNGHYWLGVHIADVSHYVKEGSALDEEAYERGTSVYFTERAVHMFPAELATGLCSLNPHVDRLVQSCLMEVDRRGHVVRYEIHDGVINSDARMTYTAVNAILTDGRDPAIARVSSARADVRADARAVRDPEPARRRRGSIDFDLPEAEVILSEFGEIEAIVAERAQRRAPPHRGVHAARERDGGGAPRRARRAVAAPRARSAGREEGRSTSRSSSPRSATASAAASRRSRSTSSG